MRTLTIMALLLSFSALAQTRVKENIKQQVITSSEDSSAPVARPVKRQKPVKK